MRARRIVVVCAGGIAVFLGMASAGWACYVAGTSPYVAMEPHNAPAGARVSVTGGNWVANADAVQIRWDSANGPLKAQAQPNPANQGSFSVVVTVPEDSPGPHMIYAVQPGSETQATVVQITAPAQATVAVDPGVGTRPSNTAVSTNGGAARTPAPVAPAAVVQPSANTAVAAIVFPDSAASASGAVAGQAPARASAASTGAQRSAQNTRAAQSNALAGAPAADDRQRATEPVGGVPSARSASGDVWSGLANGSDRARGLADLPGATASAQGANSALVGVGLLVAGMAALLGGFGVAEVRRRKVAVTPSARPSR